jgi:DNA-binding transcriptional LysR family regulator
MGAEPNVGQLWARLADHSRFWRQCRGTRPSIEPRLVIPDLILLLEAVMAGTGISVLPTYLCAEPLAVGRLVALWMTDPPVTNDLWVAYRARDRQRPEVIVARDALLNQQLCS